MSIPVEFPGTAEEAAANRLTHVYGGEPGDERCFNCDCRPSYTAASYPCGATVPRMEVR
jgi:hypothetical protein